MEGAEDLELLLTATQLLYSRKVLTIEILMSGLCAIMSLPIIDVS